MALRPVVSFRGENRDRHLSDANFVRSHREEAERGRRAGARWRRVVCDERAQGAPAQYRRDLSRHTRDERREMPMKTKLAILVVGILPSSSQTVGWGRLDFGSA